jgi:hypothetical protein
MLLRTTYDPLSIAIMGFGILLITALVFIF